MIFRRICVFAVLVAVLASFCLADDLGVPVTPAQYQAQNPPLFPPPVVRLYNIRRALDESLSPDERNESLRLSVLLAGDDPHALDEVWGLIGEMPMSGDFAQTALMALLKTNQPKLAPCALGALPLLPPGQLRNSVFEWLSRNAQRDNLADLAKAWALERPDGRDESRYREVTSRVAGVPWEQALLDGINAPSFFARGSAMMILASRVNVATLRAKLAVMTPRTEAMATLKSAVAQLEYVPANGAELLAAVMIYRVQGGTFAPAVNLNRRWRHGDGYRFNIRDYHLLSRLDDGRRMLNKDELIALLGRSLARRQHVRCGAVRTDVFAEQIPFLSTPDLWNLYLLEQMFSRPRVGAALRVLAVNSGEASRAYGGLVFCTNGKAEATLYESSSQGGGEGFKYVPAQRLLDDARDSMCRLIVRLDRSSRQSPGPSKGDIEEAVAGNYYGLMVTSVSDDEFCAHYFGPSGVVISLGRFPYGQ